MNESFLDKLNESQQQAVLYNDGPSLVIAGAGSGKTRVLTCKIAYLLQQGYYPSSILALTFTNKAAREMKERIARLVGEESAVRLWMGTFHSIFLRILRIHASELGYGSQLTIYDTQDSKSLIHTIIKELELNDKEYPDGKVLSRISSMKNRLITAEGYEAQYEMKKADESSNFEKFHIIYHVYQERCKRANAMDFDDLLVNTYRLFDEHPDVLAKYAQRFQYILVDEYQDTNYAQRQIILQLGSVNRRVCVVGDDAQSIYSFRGANIDNILLFQRDFADAKLFKLEQNYRSTQSIVLAANSLIKKNHRQIEKSIFSNKAVGEKILVSKAYSDIEEAVIVVRKIREIIRKEGASYSDFAILYRTNAQSRVFEEELRKGSISYRIYGGLSFYQRKEVKDVIAYFRLVVNPDDEEALKRIINLPARGIGDTTVNKIKDAAIKNEVSLWTVLGDPERFGVHFNSSKMGVLRQFYEMIQQFAIGAATKDAATIGNEIISQSGLMRIQLSDMADDNERKENIGELMTGMKDYVTSHQEEGDERILLSNYLSEISLLTDQDTDKDENKERVTLMTIHSAKGLEFTTVFVVGLEENLFPSYMSVDSERQLEEERRLFYVAITRAEKHCFLSYAESRYHFGKVEYARPSRFLKDIDDEYLNYAVFQTKTKDDDERPSKYRPVFPDNQPAPPFFTPKPQSNARPTVPAGMKRVSYSNNRNSAASGSNDSDADGKMNLHVGQLIEHERFGVGEVKKIEGSGESIKAAVEFRNIGVKTLLLRFARFKVIG